MDTLIAIKVSLARRRRFSAFEYFTLFGELPAVWRSRNLRSFFGPDFFRLSVTLSLGNP